MTNTKPPAPSTRASGFWTTIVSVLVTVFGILDSQQVLAILPPKWGTLITAAGAVLGAWGLIKHTDQSST